tara:strand:+ start:158 stop:1288 length:1131 start_codon:yes stop_codon:yes gene_type:complete
MAKYSIKCSRCGAPIQWNKTALNVSCEYCGQPVNQFKKEDNFKNKFGTFLNKIPLPSKESIRDKAKVLLSKQNVISENQLEFVGINASRFFSKKRNIAILVSIPIAAWGYMKINYPIKAKPFLPELPSKPPAVNKETGKLFLYDKSNIREEIIYRKHLCKDNQYRKRTKEEKTKCINLTKKFKRYIDIGSKKEFGEWSIFNQANIAKWNKDSRYPSYTQEDGTGLYDVAVNCKRKLIAFYSEGFPDWYSSFSSWDELDNKQFGREIPHYYVKKMGKLWWTNNYSYNEDFENGEYLSWQKERVNENKEYLNIRLKDKNFCPYNEKFKHKCTPLARQESIDTFKRALESSLDTLKGERLSRKRDAFGYNKLMSKVCKI